MWNVYAAPSKTDFIYLVQHTGYVFSHGKSHQIQEIGTPINDFRKTTKKHPTDNFIGLNNLKSASIDKAIFTHVVQSS